MKRFYKWCALRWAKKHGFEGECLPRGGTSSETCPLHNATGYAVSGWLYYAGRKELGHLPLGVQFFIKHHDRGAYPELQYPGLQIQAGDIGEEIGDGEIQPLEIPTPQTVPQEPAPEREPVKV